MNREQRNEKYLQRGIELATAVEAQEKQKLREQCPQAMLEWQRNMQAKQDARTMRIQKEYRAQGIN